MKEKGGKNKLTRYKHHGGILQQGLEDGKNFPYKLRFSGTFTGQKY